MSPVGFTKWQYPLLIFLNVPVDFKAVQFGLSNLRKCHIALSNFRVKSPNTNIDVPYVVLGYLTPKLLNTIKVVCIFDMKLNFLKPMKPQD